jgi:heptosyltransferase-2
MNIAVFLPNWIGDVVMATPPLRALRQHFRDAHITAILKPYVAGVLEGCPWFDEQLYLDKKGDRSQRLFAVVGKLRARRPDLAVLFPNTLRSALAAWLGGCRQRIGYRRYCRGLLLTRALEPVRDKRGRIKPSPIIDAYNLLAREAGCPDPGHRMELFTSPADEQRADDVWQKEGLGQYCEVICLNPGAAFGAAKYWPTEYFARLAQRLVDTRGCGVLVLCGPSETTLAREIALHSRRLSVHTLADHPQSLGLTKACVRRADLLITTDSGPRHFAAAFDRPVVSLFGPTHIPWTETYHAKEICLQKKVPCGPCQQRVCPLDHRCMRDLLPDEVFAAALRLLGEPARKAS